MTGAPAIDKPPDRPLWRRDRAPRTRRLRGFTIVDASIAVVIFWIFANITACGIMNPRNRRAAGVEAQALAKAVEVYQIQNHRLPDQLEDLVPAQIRAIPNDPWGTPYAYTRSGDAFEVYSCGPDRTPGGGDDISSKGTSN